ncbi:MAG: acyl carrier protein [Planctomycetota bacterium]|jgi:acyl carrier protein
MKDDIIEYIVDEYVEEDDVEIDESTSLIKGGIIDSFSIVALRNWLQKEYEITIPEEMGTVENFETVTKIIELVNSRKNA